VAEGVAGTPPEERWLLPGVRAIGAASLLSALGHEVPTALFQAFANFAASAVWGLIYTIVSQEAAYLYLAAWSAVAVVGFALSRVDRPSI
jgi:hypothetical protein